MSEEDEGRDHEPSQKKLDDARARGEIPRSPDLVMAVSFLGLLMVCQTLEGGALLSFGDGAKAYLGQLGHLARGGGTGADEVAGWIAALILPLLPFFVVPGLATLALLLATRGLTFTGEKLAPKLSRINPISNAGHKFGRSGLFDFAKSVVKLMLTGVLLCWFLADRLPQIGLSLRLPATQVSALLARLLTEFLTLTALVALAIGGLDFLWQQFDFRRRNRMTRQEMTDEFKQSEGDPHMKGHRRQRAQEIAMNRMLADVPKADVIIVNPTHYAVALKWSRKAGRAPICLAKGTDEIAARIREAAASAGVPIHSDPPTSRALHAAVEIGREVRPEHYAPVAAAIRYAERMRKRARDRRGW